MEKPPIYQLNEKGYIFAHKIERLTPYEYVVQPACLYLYYNVNGTYKDIIHNTSKESFKMAEELGLIEKIK